MFVGIVRRAVENPARRGPHVADGCAVFLGAEDAQRISLEQRQPGPRSQLPSQRGLALPAQPATITRRMITSNA